jgi:hypothetical protein
VVEEEGERRQGTRASGYGSASEEVTKRRSNRSGDGKAFNTGEDNEASGSVEYSCGGGTMWCAVRVNPNHHTGQPPLIPPSRRTLVPRGLRRPYGSLIWNVA